LFISKVSIFPKKPKSSPLSYFAQKTSLNLAPNWYPIIFTCPVQSDSCPYISNIDDQNSFIVSFIVPSCFDEVQGHWQNWSRNLRNALMKKNINIWNIRTRIDTFFWNSPNVFYLNSKRNKNISGSFQPFV
jgi:hypothetical protein